MLGFIQHVSSPSGLIQLECTKDTPHQQKPRNRAIEAVSFGLAFLSPRFGSLGRTGILGDRKNDLRLYDLKGTMNIELYQGNRSTIELLDRLVGPIDPKVTSNQVGALNMIDSNPACSSFTILR